MGVWGEDWHRLPSCSNSQITGALSCPATAPSVFHCLAQSCPHPNSLHVCLDSRVTHHHSEP